jgi:hypothetical protein
MHKMKQIWRWIMYPVFELPPKQTEAVGYAFVFLAAATFAVWAQQAKSFVNDAYMWQNNQMIHYIWVLLGSGHGQETYNMLNPVFLHHFQRINQIHQIKEDFWVGWLSSLNTILFMIGAILVVVAKWRDGAGSSSTRDSR